MNKQVIVLLLTTFMIFMGINGPALAVDGVIEINQARANAGGVTPGDAPGFPVTISVSGSYRLTSNLNVSDANTDGIRITAETVTIDLNGFAIIGPGTAGTGMGVRDWSAMRTTVTNGTVRDMGNNGVFLGPGAHVYGVHVFDNNGQGITAGSGSIVRNNIVNNNAADGIKAGPENVVIGNVSTNNGGDGIDALESCTVIDNTARSNTNYGLSLVSSGYKGNVLNDNNGGNANPQVLGGIEIGTNVCGGNTTCP